MAGRVQVVCHAVGVGEVSRIILALAFVIYVFEEFWDVIFAYG